MKFKDEFLDRRIEDLYLRSEVVKENEKWEGTNIDKIVSKNFEEKVKDNKADYFLVVIEEANINSEILLKFLNLIN